LGEGVHLEREHQKGVSARNMLFCCYWLV